MLDQPIYLYLREAEKLSYIRCSQFLRCVPGLSHQTIMIEVKACAYDTKMFGVYIA